MASQLWLPVGISQARPHTEEETQAPTTPHIQIQLRFETQCVFRHVKWASIKEADGPSQITQPLQAARANNAFYIYVFLFYKSLVFLSASLSPLPPSFFLSHTHTNAAKNSVAVQTCREVTCFSLK